MLYNFVFITADANAIPVSTALHTFNGKRCLVKFLGVTSRFETAGAGYANQALRLDFTQGLYAKHGTVVSGGSSQLGSVQGIPFATIPNGETSPGHFEFHAELWGEQLTLSISRAADPPYTASASLAMGAGNPLQYLIARFDIEPLLE